MLSHASFRMGCIPRSARLSHLGRLGVQRHVLPSTTRSLFSSAPQRYTTTDQEDARALLDEPREVAGECDVLIVGGGPAGLATAIRLKQLALEHNTELNVMVLEKGKEIGAHTLSGAVIEPRTLTELIPDWKDRGAPLETPVTSDSFLFLTESSSYSLPPLPQMNNHGNYIVSLSNVVKWLGEQAEELGVEIYPETPAAHVLINEETGGVMGVATPDMGLDSHGMPKDTFSRGFEMHAKLTILAEGCRGSISKVLMDRFSLGKDCSPQSYSLGIKELWNVRPEVHQPGKVVHTAGWPLTDAYGGSFLYHLEGGQVAVGFVTGLDYPNPYFSPYEEFQRWKHHPSIKPTFEGGTPIGYGARTLVKGGLQSLPAVSFPGGALVGDSAGFLNMPKIKGTHTAMKSGMVCAETAFEALNQHQEDASSTPITLSQYRENLKNTWLWEELHRDRNINQYLKRFGPKLGAVASAFDSWILRGKAPWTLTSDKPDHAYLKPAKECTPIQYPAPDGKISFSRLENVSRSSTWHREGAVPHLKLKSMETAEANNRDIFDGPEGRYCPAGVYEWLDGKLQINYTNCVHCKACDIKDPKQNIDWTTPEGGGPLYSGM